MYKGVVTTRNYWYVWKIINHNKCKQIKINLIRHESVSNQLFVLIVLKHFQCRTLTNLVDKITRMLNFIDALANF